MSKNAKPSLLGFHEKTLALVKEYPGLKKKYGEYGSKHGFQLPKDESNAQSLVGEMLVGAFLGAQKGWKVQFTPGEGIDLVATVTVPPPSQPLEIPVQVRAVFDRSEKLYRKTFESGAGCSSKPLARIVDSGPDIQAIWSILSEKLSVGTGQKRLLAVVDAAGVYDFEDEIVPILGLKGQALDERRQALLDGMPQVFNVWKRRLGRPLLPNEESELTEETLKLNLDLATRLNEQSWHSLAGSTSHILGVLWLEVIYFFGDDPLACLKSHVWINPS